jgi:hypothetical protein
MSKNKAWIQYTKQGEIVPGSLIVSPRRPVNGVWYEVVTDICCDTEPPFGLISSKQKAFVKYDASGNIVPGSLVLTDGRLPKPGIWKEVYVDICCNSIPYKIGDLVEDGYVCYIDPAKQFVFIASPVGDVFDPNSSDQYSWGPSDVEINVVNPAIGTGENNTNLIIAADNTPTIAAAMCQAKGLGWFLPSKDEFLNGVGANAAQMPFINPVGLQFFWTSNCPDIIVNLTANKIIKQNYLFSGSTDPRGVLNHVVAYKTINL